MSSADAGRPGLSLAGKKRYLLLALGLIGLDQAVKQLVASFLKLYETRDVIRGFFRIWRVHNPGAVWGLFSDHAGGLIPKIITVLALAALALVAYYFVKVPARCRLELFSFTFVLAGALGNLIDRLRLGYVIDFLDMYVGRHHWPTYNLADMCISTGVVLLAWSIWRGKCTQF